MISRKHHITSARNSLGGHGLYVSVKGTNNMLSFVFQVDYQLNIWSTCFVFGFVKCNILWYVDDDGHVNMEIFEWIFLFTIRYLFVLQEVLLHIAISHFLSHCFDLAAKIVGTWQKASQKHSKLHKADPRFGVICL